MDQHEPRQHRDPKTEHPEVPEGARPTSDQPLHAERRPMMTPLLLTVGLVVLILVVFAVVFAIS